MANSKAQDLKNSYVNGIIDGMRSSEAVQVSGGKLANEIGQQASMFIDLDRGTSTPRNDGDPHIYVKKHGNVKRNFYRPEPILSLEMGLDILLQDH